MEKEQCLKVTPTVGFCVSKMWILTSRKDRTLVDQMNLMKSVWIIFTKNPYQTTRRLAEQVDCNKRKLVDHVHSTRKIQKFGSWVPHFEQKKKNRNQCSTITGRLLTWHCSTYGHKHHFLYCIVTVNKKKNSASMSIWSSEKNDLAPKNKRLREQNKTFIPKRPCCVYGETGKA